MSKGQEITVTLTFRVEDEIRLRKLTRSIIDTQNYVSGTTTKMDNFSLKDCVERVISHRVGDWPSLGLELADS